MTGFIADENIAPRVIKFLRDSGLDVLSVTEEKLYGCDDEKILKLAIKLKRIVITHDKDFGALIHQPNRRHSGIVLLRFKNQSPQNVIYYLSNFLKKINLKDAQNKIIVIKEDLTRISYSNDF